jgi:Protein of unknown function (DUF1579)
MAHMTHFATWRGQARRSICLKSCALVSLLLVGVSASADGQPGQEQKKLDYLVGRWRVEIDVKAVGTMPGSKASGTEDCEWFANLHVICRSEATGPSGLYKAMRVISYLPAVKQYSSYSVDSLGYAVLTLGQIAGSTWTFSSEIGGYKTRSVMKTTKDDYTATAEYAGADGKWTTSSIIKAVRAK